MCAETCWTRTMNLSQNDCPFGRQQAAADVPTVLVTFGKRAHKQTVSHGSSSGVNADNRAQSRRRCAATWQIIRVRIKQRWDQHRGDRSFKFVCFVFVGWHSLPVSCFYSILFYSITTVLTIPSVLFSMCSYSIPTIVFLCSFLILFDSILAVYYIITILLYLIYSILLDSVGKVFYSASSVLFYSVLSTLFYFYSILHLLWYSNSLLCSICSIWSVVFYCVPLTCSFFLF